MPMQKAERENAGAMQLSKGEETAGEQVKGRRGWRKAKRACFLSKGKGHSVEQT